MSVIDAVRPDQADIKTAAAAMPSMRDYFSNHPTHRPVALVVEDEHRETVTVPRSAFVLLARILEHMARGEGLSLVPAHAELTTQQAADLLNVSRPFLIQLLEDGAIEYRKIGSHRRVRADSLVEYMRADDRDRRSAADDLTALAQEFGTF